MGSTIHEIVPGLWIGSLLDLKRLDDIWKTNETKNNDSFHLLVVTVMSSESLIKLATNMVQKYQQQYKDTNLNVRHVIWRLPDDVNSEFLSHQLDGILQEMNNAIVVPATATPSPRDETHHHSACLVHCAQGISRSAAVCAAWLIAREGHTLESSLETIRRVKPKVKPNLGFLAALRALEKCHGNVQQAMERWKQQSNKSETNTET